MGITTGVTQLINNQREMQIQTYLARNHWLSEDRYQNNQRDPGEGFVASDSCTLGLQNTCVACWCCLAAPSSLSPRVWLVIHVRVGSFTVCSNLLQNKVTQTEAQTELFSLIQHVFPHRTDGYISGVLMCSAGKLKLLNLAVRRGLYCRFTSVQEGHKLQEVTDACCIWAPILPASAPTRASVVIATHTWAAWQMSCRLKEMAFYRFTGEQWRPGGKWIQNMVHYSLLYKNEPKLSFLS